MATAYVTNNQQQPLFSNRLTLPLTFPTVCRWPSPFGAVESAAVEGAAVEGAAVEGAAVEGAAVEGAPVEGAAVCNTRLPLLLV
jgi:hypothetical protein